MVEKKREDSNEKIRYESKIKSDLLQKAGEFETRALHLRRINASSEDIGLAYLDAGDLRKKAGDLRMARRDYLDARVYGFPYNTKVQNTIDRGIQELDDELALSNFKESGRDLGSRLHAFLSIGFLLAALFFVTSSLTGNVVAGLVSNKSRLIGICFFACGLIFAFIYSKKKLETRKNKSK
jgi:hypothetical protein